MKRIFLLTLTTFLLAACSTKKEEVKDAKKENTTEKTEKVDLEKLELPQLTTEVKADDVLVNIETTEGNIKIKMFPQLAPNAVENFVEHAKEGYYNGVTFHRVIQNFMIQGGDPKGDGTGGESIWNGKDDEKDPGTGFANEISNQLYNIYGSISMANTGQPYSNGSQFFINTNKDDMSDGLLSYKYPSKIIEAYKNGGNPHLDGAHPVFGQVVDGMDTVLKIEQVQTTDGQTPSDPPKIVKIEVLQDIKK